MSAPAGLGRTEALRKLVHVSCVLFALSFRWIPWPAALALALLALAFNALVLPRAGGVAILRDTERARGWSAGILWYPASIALLVLLFRERLDVVAGAWGLLAVGDGMATVVGRALGRRALPWSAHKTWEGFAAHVVLGGLAAWALISFVGPRGSLAGCGAGLLLAVAACAALVTATLESIELGVDDNLLVSLAGAAVLWYGGLLAVALPATDWTAVGSRLTWAGPVTLVLALGGWAAGTITRAGAVAAALNGALVAAFGGPWALLLLLLFFILGSGATKLGRRVKEARGIAQERGGRRGIPHVFANGGVAALCAVPLGAADTRWGWLPVLAVALSAALATAAADTVSSEVGKAFGRRTFLVTTLRDVPPGTEGALSVEGTLAGVAASVVVGATGAAWLVQAGCAAQPGLVVAVVVVGALVGTTFESVVGAVSAGRGSPLNGHLLNFANTAVGACVAATLHALNEPPT